MGEFPQTRMGTRLADLSIPSVPRGRTPTWPPSLTRGAKAPTTAHAHFSSADKHGLFEHIGLRPASHIPRVAQRDKTKQASKKGTEEDLSSVTKKKGSEKGETQRREWREKEEQAETKRDSGMHHPWSVNKAERSSQLPFTVEHRWV